MFRYPVITVNNHYPFIGSCDKKGTRGGEVQSSSIGSHYWIQPLDFFIHARTCTCTYQDRVEVAKQHKIKKHSVHIESQRQEDEERRLVL